MEIKSFKMWSDFHGSNVGKSFSSSPSALHFNFYKEVLSNGGFEPRGGLARVRPSSSNGVGKAGIFKGKKIRVFEMGPSGLIKSQNLATLVRFDGVELRVDG
tara:strand:- start:68 stop:373 length:306 start_codon:yes stop_codon:yes gene_type:complete